MADDSDDPDKAAERLEAALERIAQLAAPAPAPVVAAPELNVPPPADLQPEEPTGEEADDEDLTADVAARLDGLIARLRAALGTNAD